jgi:hypothetical protein
VRATRRDDGRRATPGDPRTATHDRPAPARPARAPAAIRRSSVPATTDEVVGEGRFALGLAARVRSLETGPRPPTGDAPDAAPDAHPALAHAPAADAPAHRAAVPAAYAAIVRETFAHRAPRTEATSMTDAAAGAAAIRDFQETVAAVRAEIAKVVVGHTTPIERIVTAFFAGGHVLIEGVPGIGKTLLVARSPTRSRSG